MSPLLGLLLALQGPLAPQAGLQTSQPPAPAPRSDRVAASMAATPPALRPDQVGAVMAASPPVLDGRDDETVWRRAALITDFREVRPIEGGPPRQRTEARVAYDARYLYLFVRAWDTAPDSIVAQLARRDVFTDSDQIGIMIDAYHDRRSGHEFFVNPLGVKADLAVTVDGKEDEAWDAVWDVATAIDSLGWTAEFRIPFSQLRFTPSESVSFGFMVWRKLQRHTADISWPLMDQSESGFVRQWGELVGLRGIAPPRRSELTPYLVSSNEPRLGSADFARHQRTTIGGDLKYAVASNLTLSATVNPDFGQVEADPAELNLSAFESFFSERRPFFLEGGDLFSMNVDCFITNDCRTGQNLFYSRRIGRAPTLAGINGDASAPTSTRILGAAKLTGRLAGGLSLGVMNALTEQVTGGPDATLEPRTNYTVARLTQDFAEGDANVGLLVTGVNRSLDASTEGYLHRSAYAAGLDARRRFGAYEVSGMVSASRVAGTPEAIERTQRSSTHYLQRPGMHLDPTRTDLTGYAAEVRFAKFGGERTRFETGFGRRSAGYEVNDLGFLQRADEQKWSNWFNLRWTRPNRVYQQVRWNFNYSQTWNMTGLVTDRAFNTNLQVQLTNRWWVRVGNTFGAIGGTWCDLDCTRGGPALREDGFIAPWVGISGDSRKAIVPSLRFNGFRGDGGRSSRISLSPDIDFKLSTALSSSLGINWSRNTRDRQFYGQFDDPSGGVDYTFAHLEQETLGLTWRLGYTFSPTASLQLYAQPFVSKGDYSDVRELADPTAAAYADRFRPYGDEAVAQNPGGFNFSQFRSNVVFRWEYNPGSTLFVVWSQGREGFLPMRGQDSFGGNFGDLFGRRANDVFLVKLSYWLNR